MQDILNAINTRIMNAKAFFAKRDENPKPNKRNSNHWASHKGYVHKVNPTFLSRPILAVSPAQFRRNHMGRTSPRWKNRRLRNVAYTLKVMGETNGS